MAMRALLAARLVALRKPNGKVRPIACGSVVRRLAARAACDVFRADISRACGPFQYAVGKRAGCEVVHKCLTALAEGSPQAVVLAFDVQNAYNSVPRGVLLAAVARRAPALLPLAHAWLAQPTTHLYWDEGTSGHGVRAERGVDQGCPLSPAFFAIAIADALESVHSTLHARAPSARVFSYLDDIMVFVPAELAPGAIEVVGHALAAVGLTLEPSKTRVWSKDPATPLLPALHPLRVSTLTCLGAQVPWLESEEERVALHAPADGAQAVARAVAFRARLSDLRRAGLRLESAHTLLQAYAQGCVTHHLRANWERAWVEQLDAVLFGALEDVLGQARRSSVVAAGVVCVGGVSYDLYIRPCCISMR